MDADREDMRTTAEIIGREIGDQPRSLAGQRPLPGCEEIERERQYQSLPARVRRREGFGQMHLF
jgi:hypothetical protein